MDKPKVVVSRCIEFDNCRWNGLKIANSVVKKLMEFVEFIPVCPEVEIGLGIPRDPIRLIEKDGPVFLANSMTEEDHTSKMNEFSRKYLQTLPQIQGFILKSRSPSCGTSGVKVYPKAGKVMVKHARGIGLFAEAVLDKFPLSAIEDEGRLLNLRIREHFLTKLFTIQRFHRLPQKMGKLVEFHSNHKYLFMAYNQTELKQAGKIAANHEKHKVDKIFSEYAQVIQKIFARMPRQTTLVNVVLHIFGYFSQNLNAKEKELFFDSLERYRKLQIPLIALTSLLNSWTARFDIDYLQKQFFLQPYPADLQTIFDSGKGRMF